MSRKNTKTFDVAAIVDLFGGKHQIVLDYEKILKSVLTVKAVEKWIERKKISSEQLLNLKSIAERRGIQFSIEAYIK